MLTKKNPVQAKKGYGGFLTELQRCERLGLTMYNFHPGSTTGESQSLVSHWNDNVRFIIQPQWRVGGMEADIDLPD